MKKLSIEEKAKAYDEAIEKLRSLHDNYDTVSTLIDVKEELEHIFPALKEKEDERIREELILLFQDCIDNINHPYNASDSRRWIAWLEKQGEHANFRNKIQIGDKVTRNEDGVLVNLSQLNRVARKNENQCEQKPAWSEEDDKAIKALIAMCDEWAVRRSYYPTKCQPMENLKEWLKSLSPQPHWKPSDEQMQALKDAFNDAIMQYDFKNSPIKEEVTRKHAETIESLYNDLKKLRGNSYESDAM